MKTFIAAIVIIGVSACVNANISDEERQQLEAYRNECIAQTGVDAELVKRAREGHFSHDPKSLKFAGCMARKLEFQDPSGKPQPEVILKKLAAALGDEAVAKKLMETCVVGTATPDENALAATECYYKNTPNKLVFV